MLGATTGCTFIQRRFIIHPLIEKFFPSRCKERHFLENIGKLMEDYSIKLLFVLLLIDSYVKLPPQQAVYVFHLKLISVCWQVGAGGGLSVVVITNPRGHQHLGHYLCTANSTLGTDSKTLQLRGDN